jgi:hypothetical protein
VTQLRRADTAFLRKRSQQQRLQPGNHHSADTDQEDDAEL